MKPSALYGHQPGGEHPTAGTLGWSDGALPFSPPFNNEAEAETEAVNIVDAEPMEQMLKLLK